MDFPLITMLIYPKATGFTGPVRYNFLESPEERCQRIMPEVTYLDLNVLINGVMDAFLLGLTAKILHYPVRKRGLFYGALIGEVPVVLVVLGPSPWLTLSKILVPFFMVGVSLGSRGWRPFLKALLGFWLLSAGLGGFIYAAWDWLGFGGMGTSRTFALAPADILVLPLLAVFWSLGQRVWLNWSQRARQMELSLYDLEIDFGEEGKVLRVKALLDTGNQLRDPLTGAPVILLEEGVAVDALPEKTRGFLRLPWRESGDPWSLLWKGEPGWFKSLVFIPFKGIEGESWLLGVRPKTVAWNDGEGRRSVQATVALVRHALSPEGTYQALLHFEHMKGGAGVHEF
ncbi:sporulation sigma-E factor-processing peptidase [Peptococcaceae bacterium CEB3]|nr:sporulation sigma-E factor-processing peptidase [Peptococcaceae bacterium CEB3]